MRINKPQCKLLIIDANNDFGEHTGVNNKKTKLLKGDVKLYERRAIKLYESCGYTVFNNEQGAIGMKKTLENQ